MYLNGAIPPLARAAMYQGSVSRFLRCPYQTNFMKMLEQTSSLAVLRRADRNISGIDMARARSEKKASRETGAWSCIDQTFFGVFSQHLI